jgi:GT2 family glycosyltransferase
MIEHNLNYTISILIVNYKSEKFLVPCLSSIRFNRDNINYEGIIIDNGSDSDIQKLIQKFPLFKLIKNDKNFGFSFAVNQGIKSSNGKYIFLLNPDTVIGNQSITKLIAFLDENPDVGIVGVKVFDKDGKTVQLSCRSFPSFNTVLFNRYSLMTKLFPKNKWSVKYLLANWDHSYLREVDWVSGCCMVLRREMLNQIGLLDTRFFMYNEDVDICLRAKKNQWRVFYFPEFDVKHHIGGSSNLLKKQMIIERHRSIWRFYKKHYRRNFVLYFLIFTIILIRALYKIIISKRFI